MILRTKSVLAALTLLLSVTVINAQVGNTTLGTGAGASLTTGDYATFIGDSAGTNTTSGLNLTFIGEQAGFSNTTASDNVFIGQDAGRTNTTGTDNTYIGKRAGYNSTSTDNTFIGTEAGEANTSGSDNTFVGEEAGQANTTGRDNTFIGEDAGFNNTDGDDNTFIGSTAGRTNTTGYRNTAVGNEAGYDFSTGHHLTAIGDSAGVDNGSGIYNTFVGAAAGAATEHADRNTMVGAYSGWDNNRTNSTSNANRNTYVGFYTGFTNREGSDNVGMGADANFTNTNRSRTTFVGADAIVGQNDATLFGYRAEVREQYGIAIGSYATVKSGDRGTAIGAFSIIDNNSHDGISIGYLNRITLGSTGGTISIGTQNIVEGARQSIAVGSLDTMQADSSVLLGSAASAFGLYNVAIGHSVFTDTSAVRSIVVGAHSRVSGSNSVVIGEGVALASSDEVYLGNTATASIGGIVNWTATSDGRFKENIKEDVPGLEFIDRLRPVTYHLDGRSLGSYLGHEKTNSLNAGYLTKGSTRYSGFIAQEVASASDESGYDFSGIDRPREGKEVYGLRYAEFVVPLVKATQELHNEIKTLKGTISTQQELLTSKDEELNDYRAALMELSARVDALEESSSNQVDDIIRD